MPETQQTHRSPRPEHLPQREESKPKDQRPSAKTTEEWDKVLDDIDEAIAEQEATESAESFVQAYRQKGGQ